MNNNKNMELLFRYACSRRFEDFDALFSKMEAEMSPDTFWEAYLLRAQIKLYSTDLTVLYDLAKAEQGSGRPQFSLLITNWKIDYLNRLILFPRAPGALKDFLSVLPLLSEKFSHWYGSQSDAVLLQLQGEILYFMGDIDAAMSFVEAQRAAEPENPTSAILALILEYRCCLALLQPEKAHQCMFGIIRHSKAYPECVEIYKGFRIWANLTTSWSGDSPRFYDDEYGKKHPVLADRMEGIRLGVARDTPLEYPFLKYAEKSYEGIYSLRQYYMDWFHAMYWCSINDQKQTEAYFHKVYEVAAASGVFMPIIECGAQSIPTLNYMKSSGMQLPLDNLVQRAAHYEECLGKYRLADN